MSDLENNVAAAESKEVEANAVEGHKFTPLSILYAVAASFALSASLVNVVLIVLEGMYGGYESNSEFLGSLVLLAVSTGAGILCMIFFIHEQFSRLHSKLNAPSS